MNSEGKQAMEKLRTEEVVLGDASKNQPIIVYQYMRWHLIMISFVHDPEIEAFRGIASINFMSSNRAKNSINEWLPHCPIVGYDKVSQNFRKELETKLRQKAEDYRELLIKGQVKVSGGFTSNTLQSVTSKTEDVSILIAMIDRMMKEGETGPFLRFDHSARVINCETE